MVEVVDLDVFAQESKSAPESLVLQRLLCKLFSYKGVEFYDAEPDTEFFKVFDATGNVPVDEQREALQNFVQELRLEEEFGSRYAKMSEIVMQSEDFLDRIKMPLLMFSLSDGNDAAGDTYYSFRIDSFDVLYVGNGCYVVMLMVRNTVNNHMEIFLRFSKSEAQKVVRAILRVYEELTGYENGEAFSHLNRECDFEETIARKFERKLEEPTASNELAIHRRFL